MGAWQVSAAESFGRAIVLVRTVQGLDRKSLAVRASISYPYLSEIEVGHKEPSSTVTRALADALACEVSALFALAERLLRGENVLAL